MSNLSATGTVFNLPNYIGQVYTATPAETPFLNLIAPKAVKTDNFQFSTGAEYTIDDAAQPEISEADAALAPSPISYVRTQVTNVTQIFHETVSVTYSRLANTGRLSGVTGSLGADAAANELDFQTARALERIARNAEYTFLNGTYNLAEASDEANMTRGMINACATTSSLSGAPLTKSALNAVLKSAYDSGATFTGMVILCGSDVKQQLTDIYSSQWGSVMPAARQVGGMNIMQIETDFGAIAIVLSRFIPSGTLIGADISCIRPVELEVPGKGNFFREQLSKTGAAEEYQIYGQLGLDHGPMWKHFLISDIGSGESRTPILVSGVGLAQSGSESGENGSQQNTGSQNG